MQRRSVGSVLFRSVSIWCTMTNCQKIKVSRESFSALLDGLSLTGPALFTLCLLLPQDSAVS